ncbi:hypothetical protein LSPH24S_10015 [Lysinibacillus sphaericus]
MNKKFYGQIIVCEDINYDDNVLSTSLHNILNETSVNVLPSMIKRFYLVNLDYIASYTKEEIILDNVLNDITSFAKEIYTIPSSLYALHPS